MHIYDISLVVLVVTVAVLYTQSSLLNINKNLHSRLTSLRLGLLDSTKLNVSWTPGRAGENLAQTSVSFARNAPYVLLALS